MLKTKLDWLRKQYRLLRTKRQTITALYYKGRIDQLQEIMDLLAERRANGV